MTRSFREEHRIALDWLNGNTGEAIRFFGVVVRALRVGESLPAPLFELAAKPNDWQKSVKATTTGKESAQAEAFRAFWSPVREAFVTARPDLLHGRSEPRSIWCSMNSPIAGSILYGEIGTGELRVKLEIDTGDRERNLALLEELETQRAPLEARLGELDFHPGEHRCMILRRKPWAGRLLDEPDRYDEAREWFRESLLAFSDAFEAVSGSLPQAAGA